MNRTPRNLTVAMFATLIASVVCCAALFATAYGHNHAHSPSPSPGLAVAGATEVVLEPAFVKTFEDRGIHLAPALGAVKSGPTSYGMPLKSVDVFGNGFRINSIGGLKFWNAAHKRYTFFNFSVLSEKRYLAANNNGSHRVGIFRTEPVADSLVIQPGRRPLIRFSLALTLSEVSARVLNATFKTTTFAPGQPVGVEKLQLRLHRNRAAWPKLKRHVKQLRAKFKH